MKLETHSACILYRETVQCYLDLSQMRENWEKSIEWNMKH